MIGDWQVKNLTDYFEVKSSKRVHKSDWKDDGIPFYRAREIVKLSEYGEMQNELFISQDLFNEFTEKTGYPKSGDIVISAVGTLGKCYLVQENDLFYFKDASVLWFKKIKPINSRFIIYLFKSEKVLKQVLKGSMGATVGTLTITRAKRIEIPVPPLPEQERIVAILDEAFEKIDRAQANIEKNIANAEELFQSKLDEVFSQTVEGWEEKKLGEVSYLKSGGTPSRSKMEFWQNGAIPWYSSGELNDLYTTEPERYITEEGLHNSNARIFPKGSLLIGMYDTAALKMSIIDRDATFNQAITGMEPNKNINLKFVFYSINSKKRELLKLRRGVRQKNLSLTKIKEINLDFPSIHIQHEIVNKLNTLSNTCIQLRCIYENKLKYLNDLRDSLLGDAFEGKLAIKDCQS